MAAFDMTAADPLMNLRQADVKASGIGRLGYCDERLRADRSPTSQEIAWAAGLYEGEGYCVVAGSYEKNGKVYPGSEKVEVAQKNPEILNRMRSLFGGSVNKIVGRHPHFRWIMTGARARGFLMTMYTFLSERRKMQIRNLGFLDMAKSVKPLVGNTEERPLRQRNP